MTKTREVMRKMIRMLAIVLAIVIQIKVEAHAQQQPSQVVSVGGGPSTGGNYTQFSVIGGEPVQSNISGGSFSGQAGFLYRANGYYSPVAVDAQVELNENSAVNDRVHIVAATDADGNPITYSITSGNESGAFAINSSTGAITVANSLPLDFETTKVFTLIVRVSDGTATDDATITVNLMNLNDNNPVAVDAQVEVNENLAVNSPVHTVVSTDADGDILTFSITAGNEAGAFAINSSTGAITVADSTQLDYETVTQFVLAVRVSDGTFTDDATVTVNLKNLDDIPRYIISGNVVTSEGNPLVNGTVDLFKEEKGAKVQVQSIALNGEGKFLFQDLLEGSFTLKIVPLVNNQDPLPLLSTYLGGTQLPAEATVFLLNKDLQFPNITVLRQLPVEQAWSGKSSISGILVEDDKASGEGGRIMSGLHTQEGTPMAEAQVFLLDPDTKAIKFSEKTDAAGKFSFNGIASRKYSFLVEYKGKSFEMAQILDLSQENSTVEVTAVVSEKGLNATVSQITALKEEVKGEVLMYPNPVKDKLFISLENLSPGQLEITILDGHGKILKIHQIIVSGGGLVEEMDFSTLPNGLYLVSLRQSDSVFYRKIMKN